MVTNRSEDQIAQTSGTTSTTVDGETTIAKMVDYVPLNRGVLDNAVTTSSQEVKDFLAKPIIITSGVLATTDAASTWKYEVVIPQSLLYGNLMWWRKIEGNFAFRGTLHLTLQVNGTKFQQGLYIMAWVPSGGAQNEEKWSRMHANTLTQVSQLPHVELDVSCDTEATLIIPHVTANGWAALDLTNLSMFGNNGRVIMLPYVPLQVSTGSTTANYTIIGHWEDVELAMPINPQSGRAGTRSKVSRKIRPSEAEQNSAGIGSFSSGLARVATAAGFLSNVPLLSSIAGNVKWAAELASRSAKSFGWSKPHIAAVTGTIVQSIVPKYTNADTADSATKMGFFDGNEVEDLPGFAGSDLDEMNLSYIASISGYFNYLSWSSSAATGTLLYGMVVSPRSFYTTTVKSGTTLTHLTPVSFVSSLFALYRGSIKLTFKLVKTEFHSGRLMLAFHPFDQNVSPSFATGSYANANYVHRQIIDVRDGNEFSFIIPYTSLTTYRHTAGSEAIYGRLYLWVMNPLVAPSAVPASIGIIMEAAAGPDFEWAQQADISGMMTQTWTPQSGRNDCEIVSGVLGNASLNHSDAGARLCIGERVMSMRTLVKRFNRLLFQASHTPSAFFCFRPFEANISYIDTAVAHDAADYWPDMYTICCGIYALSRGGVRVKLINNDASPTNSVETISTTGAMNIFTDRNFEWYPTVPWINSGFKAGSPSIVTNLQHTGAIELEFPYYCRTPVTSNADICQSAGTGNGMYYSPKGSVPHTICYTWFKTTPTTTPTVMRAVSEDHSFGLFVSIPPWVNYNADSMTG